MGPSGAGKSTLLYALMGTARYGVARGRLCVNGREMRLERLRRILGYVPQVRRALRFRSRAGCLPGRHPRNHPLPAPPKPCTLKSFSVPIPCLTLRTHVTTNLALQSGHHLVMHTKGGMHMSMGLVAG